MEFRAPSNDNAPDGSLRTVTIKICPVTNGFTKSKMQSYAHFCAPFPNGWGLISCCLCVVGEGMVKKPVGFAG